VKCRKQVKPRNKVPFYEKGQRDRADVADAHEEKEDSI